jgi:hypothetical protein
MNEADEQQLRSRFAHHRITDPASAENVANVRAACLQLALYLSDLIPPIAPREKALAITHLEDVMFWSNAGIARSVDR